MDCSMNDREVAQAVQRRVAALREAGRRRRTRALAAAGALGFAVLAGVAGLPQGRQPVGTPPAQASALELAAGNSAGGYVLVGVACFALGAAFTLGCLWARGRARKGENNPPAREEPRHTEKR